jgi:hypothetical protein
MAVRRKIKKQKDAIRKAPRCPVPRRKLTTIGAKRRIATRLL